MITLTEDNIRMLIDGVKNDSVEVHLEFTLENTTIEIMPWRPLKMQCPYGREVEHD